jgi:hypothetical protein
MGIFYHVSARTTVMVEGQAEEHPYRRPSSRSGEPPLAPSDDAFARIKRQLVLACAAIGAGLAIAGTIDRTTGGVLVLAGWLMGVASLHRLGRAGSDRQR